MSEQEEDLKINNSKTCNLLIVSTLRYNHYFARREGKGRPTDDTKRVCNGRDTEVGNGEVNDELFA